MNQTEFNNALLELCGHLPETVMKFQDLFDEIKERMAQPRTDDLAEAVANVAYYGRRNPTSAPSCVLQLTAVFDGKSEDTTNA
ncbi:hypothetical protein 13VV501A_gene0071 [Vibrio phage 13VV501A]|nr:hypothetical protein 13VV501A_gene0071 [Vibrio phage 13VV501A]